MEKPDLFSGANLAVVAGVAAAAAVLAGAPPPPLTMLGHTLAGVLVTGLGSSLVSLVAFRSPFLPALRVE
ncbi:MAG: hypothetical protein DMG09_23420 [Acidobacteria bacterium]|nr:MAG: hypothetical protein DMG09_23420 [Acidobacteriota bacterium]